MTGFRLARAAPAASTALRPDLVTFGKVIGGGLPVGAFGGRRDVMDRVAPAGPIYQAGTLSGNPMAMAAGIDDAPAHDARGVREARADLGRPRGRARARPPPRRRCRSR